MGKMRVLKHGEKEWTGPTKKACQEARDADLAHIFGPEMDAAPVCVANSVETGIAYRLSDGRWAYGFLGPIPYEDKHGFRLIAFLDAKHRDEAARALSVHLAQREADPERALAILERWPREQDELRALWVFQNHFRDAMRRGLSREQAHAEAARAAAR